MKQNKTQDTEHATHKGGWASQDTTRFRGNELERILGRRDLEHRLIIEGIARLAEGNHSPALARLLNGTFRFNPPIELLDALHTNAPQALARWIIENPHDRKAPETLGRILESNTNASQAAAATLKGRAGGELLTASDLLGALRKNKPLQEPMLYRARIQRTRGMGSC